MKDPLISVLMPVYNGEKYLNESIESILNQTYKNIEFLIINDGSSDNSVKIINKYKDSRIKLFHNEKNMGLIYSLNKGLELSNGKYIARMDADDISLKNRLKVQKKYLDNHHEVGICGSWVRAFGDKKVSVWKYPKDPQRIKTQLLFNCDVIAHPATMFRKKYIEQYKLKYNKNYIFAEDWALWMESSSYFEITNIQAILLNYRLHTNNISIINQEEQKKSIKKILKDKFNELEIDATDEEIEMHRWINNYDLNLDNITKYEKWFSRLIIANENKQLYPHKELLQVIANNWFYILSGSQESGRWKLLKYKNSNFHKMITVSKYKIKNIYKIAMFLYRCING